jgi:hypothetical protein
MTTKTETLDQRAERVAAEAAEIHAERERLAQAEAQAAAERQAKLDADTVQAFNPAALDKAVSNTRAAVDQAVSDLPVTQAIAAYLAAQWRRNWARLDHDQAASRLGLPAADRPAQPAADDVKAIEQYITETATNLAQAQLDAERTQTKG